MCQTLMNYVLLLSTFHYISQTQKQNTGMKAASSRHGIEICGYTPFWNDHTECTAKIYTYK